WNDPAEQNSAFVACMEDVLDVYKRPYDQDNPVVCMDESPKQLITSSKTPIPIQKGKEERVDYEYIRHGMVNVFMANEPLKGNRLVEVTFFKKKQDWAKFIKRIAEEMYPNAKKITLVMDNFNTHNASSLYETFEPKEAKRIWDRFEFIYTPKHGSWLNMAEIELHSLNTQCLNRHFENKESVAQEVEAWQKRRNDNGNKINWQFTPEMSRVKLTRLYPSFHD
ncbi:MAG: IS630 family transposase, partial [Bacteroidota bacterium]